MFTASLPIILTILNLGLGILAGASLKRLEEGHLYLDLKNLEENNPEEKIQAGPAGQFLHCNRRTRNRKDYPGKRGALCVVCHAAGFKSCPGSPHRESRCQNQ